MCANTHNQSCVLLYTFPAVYLVSVKTECVLTVGFWSHRYWRIYIKTTYLCFPLSHQTAGCRCYVSVQRTERWMSVLLWLFGTVYLCLWMSYVCVCVCVLHFIPCMEIRYELWWRSREPQSSVFVQHWCPVIYQRQRWMQLIDCDTAINYSCNRSVMESNSHFSHQQRQAQVNV